MVKNIHLLSIIFLILFSCSQKEHNKSVSIKKTYLQNVSQTLPTIPRKINFCGQSINLTDLDLRERLDRELLVNTYMRSSTLLYIKRAHRFFPQIERILKQQRLPDDLKYLAVAESGLSQAVSPSGAKGFWQFMPEAAAEHGLMVSTYVDERFHIEKSTYAACAYLKKAKKKFNNDWFLTIASYNRGLEGVKTDMEWQGTNDYFDAEMNGETARYIFRMIALKMIMENPQNYGFNMENLELYQPFEVKKNQITKGLTSISEWAKEQGFNYKIVKLLNPWVLKNELPDNQTFELLLPAPSMNLKPRGLYN